LKRLNHIWNRTITHKSEVLCIYLSQLIFGLLIGCVAYVIINKFLGESIALEQLAKGFDRTVIMDVLNSNDNVLKTFTFWMIPFIPIYLLMSIILQGGFLYNIKKGEVGVVSQIRNGIQHFIPFLGVASISFVLLLVVAGLIVLPYSMFVGDPLTTFSSEKPFVLSILGLIGLFTVWLIIVWGWSIATRLAYVSEGDFYKSISLGLSFVKQNFLKILAVGLLFLGLHVLISFLYYIIMGDRGAPSWIIIIFGILVQQLFSFIRVFLRGMSYITVEQIEDEVI